MNQIFGDLPKSLRDQLAKKRLMDLFIIALKLEENNNAVKLYLKINNINYIPSQTKFRTLVWTPVIGSTLSYHSYHLLKETFKLYKQYVHSLNISDFGDLFELDLTDQDREVMR